jgi:putative FmdB family regulatory protein
MPIYEYRCSTCQFQDDLMLKVSAATTLQCPSCQKNTFEKLVSAPSFKLSGSGWYETDFKNKKKRANKPVTAVKKHLKLQR